MKASEYTCTSRATVVASTSIEAVSWSTARAGVMGIPPVLIGSAAYRSGAVSPQCWAPSTKASTQEIATGPQPSTCTSRVLRCPATRVAAAASAGRAMSSTSVMRWHPRRA